MAEETRPGYRWICRTWVRTRSGKKIYARNYGKQAFCFWVKE